MNGKQFKELAAQIPDDAIIVGYKSDMEQSGVMELNLSGRVEQAVMKTKQTWDRFDHTDYSYEVYESNPKGSIKVFRLF